MKHLVDGKLVAISESEEAEYTERQLAHYRGAVNAKRDELIALGIAVTLPDGRSVPVDTRDDKDVAALSGLATKAALRLSRGQPDAFGFIGADNQTHTLSPAEMLAVAEAAGAHVSKLQLAARRLKNAANLAADLSNSEHWA
jgi:hypothetical protein